MYRVQQTPSYVLKKEYPAMRASTQHQYYTLDQGTMVRPINASEVRVPTMMQERLLAQNDMPSSTMVREEDRMVYVPTSQPPPPMEEGRVILATEAMNLSRALVSGNREEMALAFCQYQLQLSAKQDMHYNDLMSLAKGYSAQETARIHSELETERIFAEQETARLRIQLEMRDKDIRVRELEIEKMRLDRGIITQTSSSSSVEKMDATPQASHPSSKKHVSIKETHNTTRTFGADQSPSAPSSDVDISDDDEEEPPHERRQSHQHAHQHQQSQSSESSFNPLAAFGVNSTSTTSESRRDQVSVGPSAGTEVHSTQVTSENRTTSGSAPLSQKTSEEKQMSVSQLTAAVAAANAGLGGIAPTGTLQHAQSNWFAEAERQQQTQQPTEAQLQQANLRQYATMATTSVPSMLAAYQNPVQQQQQMPLPFPTSQQQVAYAAGTSGFMPYAGSNQSTFAQSTARAAHVAQLAVQGGRRFQ
jgi:hypothetical protein